MLSSQGHHVFFGGSTKFFPESSYKVACCTVPYLEAYFIDIIPLRFQHLTCVFHFIVEQKTINGIPINLFKPFFEFLQRKAYLLSQGFESWWFRHTFNDDLLGPSNSLQMIFIYQVGTLLQQGVIATIEKQCD